MFFIYLLLLKAVFIALVFLFLFWAVRTNYKTAFLSLNPPPALPDLQLQIQAPGTPVFVHPLIKNVVVGRDEGADIVLTDQTVSLKHCTFFKKGTSWYLQDLKSLNGTFLNSQKIESTVKIKPGDHISLGKSVILVLGPG